MTTDRGIPIVIQEQFEEAMRTPDLTRDEAELRFPELFDWLLRRVSLVDVIRDSGVSLKPFSPDAPGIWVGDCPFCTVRT